MRTRARSRSSRWTRGSATRSGTACVACSTIPGLKEDVTDLVLNLKDVVVRMHTDADEVETPLVATGPGDIKAKDIDLPAGVEILNPEAPIATLEKKTKLEMYLTIGRGRGYSPADENKADDKPIGVVPIDSESELNAIPNFGRKSIEEVQETLRARGLGLRAE
jgi:DNA-directed RNA polymerase alpha subunit